jgi:hypothetical protein
MGISESNTSLHLQPRVSLTIKIEKLRYTAGDEVKGEIYIKIQETFGCTKLQLNMKVEQYTQFFKEHKLDSINNLKDSSLKTNYDKARKNTTASLNPNQFLEEKEYFLIDGNFYYPVTENNIIYSQKILIARFPKYRILPGEYRYPFSFELPENIPGSFEYWDHLSSAYSRCLLEVGLYTASLKNTIRSFYLIIVNQPVRFLDVVHEKTVTHNFKKFFWISKGSAVLKVTIPKEYFYTSDSIMAKCELDNRNTSLNVKLLKVSLTQVIRLKNKNKVNRTISRRVTSMNYFYFLSKRKLWTFTIELPILDYDNPTKKLCEKCRKLKYFVDEKYFPKLQGSIKSQFIDCMYYLKIEVLYDTVFSKSFFVEVPIALHIPDIETFSKQIIGSITGDIARNSEIM